MSQSSIYEIFEKFSANNFALSDAEDNTSGPLSRGGIADLPLLRTLSPLRICKFGSFKNHCATITCLPELYFRIRRFILLVQTKRAISMNHGRCTSS